MSEKIYKGPRIRLLADRDGQPDEYGTYPLAGVRFEGELLPHIKVPTSWVEAGMQRGWIKAYGVTPVVRPGGPPENPWREENRHQFLHIEYIEIEHEGGVARYVTVQQPDKYLNGEAFNGVGNPEAEINYFYLMDLEDENVEDN